MAERNKDSGSGGTSNLLRDFQEGQKKGAKKTLQVGKDAKKAADKVVSKVLLSLQLLRSKAAGAVDPHASMPLCTVITARWLLQLCLCIELLEQC